MMCHIWYLWAILLCLCMELRSGTSKAAYKGDKTADKSHHDNGNETKEEKRFLVDDVPKGRVVYSFVTDRKQVVPRRPQLYRAYIIKRPLIIPPRTTANADERQNIPYIEAQPSLAREDTPITHTMTGQPVFYYQQPLEQRQGLTELQEPWEEDEFPEIPQEFSGNLCETLSKLKNNSAITWSNATPAKLKSI